MFSTTDPLGRTIHLTDRCYEFHILVEHPDMADPNEIERSIHLADWITQDAVDSDRTVYYRTYQRRPQRWLIKVVVEKSEVITAYRVKRTKQEEIVLWQR